MYERHNYYDRLGRRLFSTKTDSNDRIEYRGFLGELSGYSTVNSYGNRNYYDRLGHKLGYKK